MEFEWEGGKVAFIAIKLYSVCVHIGPALSSEMLELTSFDPIQIKGGKTKGGAKYQLQGTGWCVLFYGGCVSLLVQVACECRTFQLLLPVMGYL